jgi:hypothetical protein
MQNHYSEVLRIIEGATRGDMKKVKAYADLLADKLDEDGEHSTATHIRKVASGNAGIQIHTPRSLVQPSDDPLACPICKAHMKRISLDDYKCTNPRCLQVWTASNATE